MMTPNSLQHLCRNSLAALSEPAARSLVLGCFTAATLALFRVRSVALRLSIWKAVLWAALAMPALAYVLPAMPLPLLGGNALHAKYFAIARNFPRHPAHLTIPVANASLDVSGARAFHSDIVRSSPAQDTHKAEMEGRSPAGTPARRQISWVIVTAAVYILIATLLFARLLIGIVFGLRLVRRSSPVQDERVRRKLAFRAYPPGLGDAPALAESDRIAVPLTLGFRKPVILFPTTWREWGEATLDAVIAHEVSHVARRDALTQRLSLLHRAIFWFSPLAWWLDRQLAELAEEASDEAALSSGADRTTYAETVLLFFEALEAAPSRVWCHGLSMAKPGRTERRVDRILAWKGAVSMNSRKSIMLAGVLLAVPLVYLTASVRPASSAQTTRVSQPPAPPVAPNAPVAHATPVALAPLPPSPSKEHEIASLPAVSLLPPLQSIASAAPLAPPSVLVRISGEAVAISQRPRDSGTTTIDVSDDNGGQHFLISSGDSVVGEWGSNITINSDATGDIDRVTSLRKKIGGDFIWFERDGKSYVIRDRATIDRAKSLYAPVEALGKQQSELGEQQSKLGEQQSAFGEQMENVKVKMPDMTAELKEVEARIEELSANGGTQSELGELQSEIGELQSRIGEIQSEAAVEQSKIGRQQSELGRRQGELGRKQGELGRQQAAASKKASQQMTGLLDDALARGLAQPE